MDEDGDYFQRSHRADYATLEELREAHSVIFDPEPYFKAQG